MEYNTTLFKVFKLVKATKTWIFFRTFYTEKEAIDFCNNQPGVFVIKEEESID